MGLAVIRRTSEQRFKSPESTRPGVTCSVGAALARDEVPALREQVGRDANCKLSALLVLDEAGPGPSGPQGRGVGKSQARQLSRLCEAGALDLLVISDRKEHIDRDLAFAIIELALESTTVCRLSRLPARAADAAASAADQGVVWHLIEAIDASRRERRAKRLLDVLVAGTGLVVTAPLFALIALIIRIDSPGPPFLVQERLGRMRVPFRCIKFRTMRNDAERDTGPIWAARDDQRITRVGRFLRRTRLDELPQLVNVLRGEMSLVGVRPIRKSFADQLAAHVPFYDLRFLDRPGLTGWAQINQDYPSTLLQQIEKFGYDYHYTRNSSLALDFYIMLRTIWTVLRMKGT
jgi:lipopolysaccharide/colanic/teichoic acid biosynthesis glycosyltransferase